MFHQHIYDLARLRHEEYNRELNNLYAPIEAKPGWVRRLSISLAQALACAAAIACRQVRPGQRRGEAAPDVEPLSG